ncbi:MAG TPA: transketolase, partial [Alphaproteobacteria bacterium]|nr:transketolase [Alphaproteobacteria bacterium]
MNSAAPATVPAMSVDHHKMATAIRFLAMDAVEAAKSGHPGLPMGMADVATVLFTQFLKFDASAPHWADRDRFILSGGHGSALIYALGYLTGYEKMTIDEVRRFRQLGSLTPGHPEHDPEIGVETTTGPLGQGIANAVGFALAERILAARFGDDLVDHYTYVMCGDGDLMEGISHEAASLAGHLGLSKLIVLYDDNGISIDGSTALSFTEDTQTRFQAYGWATDAVDGHNPAEVADAIRRAQGSDRPTLIACKTVIGYGAPTKAGTHGVHGSPLGEVEIAGARAKLGWAHEPFVIPDDILNLWREAGRRGADARRGWEGRLSGHDRRREFETAMSGGLPAELPALIEEIKRKAVEAKPSVATRVASGQILEALLPAIPELVGGSADLTPSNNTKAKVSSVIDRSNYGGRYVHWGVREHGMAAALNGLALHGGLIPYAGTFMQFTDYCRPAIRLSALMHQRVVFVMTHDSIGLGEDGPTHQPVEHLAALRAIPNLLVLRPADLVETAECWQIALESTKAPSVLALTRQNLVTARETHTAENLSAKGGYVLREATGGARKATILATGSEVEIALKAREALEAAGIPTAVVSLPCFALFDRQPEGYRKAVLGTAPRVAIEAGVGFGWERYTGDGGAFVGMTGFGASAPYQE